MGKYTLACQWRILGEGRRRRGEGGGWCLTESVDFWPGILRTDYVVHGSISDRESKSWIGYGSRPKVSNRNHLARSRLFRGGGSIPIWRTIKGVVETISG